MRARSACVLVALLLSLSWTPLFAKGGHGGGGHAGGHASGGQGSGGQPGAHSTGRSSTGRATARSGASAVVPATTTSSGHTRTGQPISGSAVPRANVPPITSTGSGVVIGPAGIWPYYGGLIGGAFYYDPFYWNPYWTPVSPWYGPGFSAPGSDDESDAAASVAEPSATGGPSGGLRLKVEQKNADVFVDGHYAGIVDDFDGMFQHLSLRPGSHHINVRAPGYEPLGIDIVVQPHHTTVYHGVLTRSQP